MLTFDQALLKGFPEYRDDQPRDAQIKRIGTRGFGKAEEDRPSQQVNDARVEAILFKAGFRSDEARDKKGRWTSGDRYENYEAVWELANGLARTGELPDYDKLQHPDLAIEGLRWLGLVHKDIAGASDEDIYQHVQSPEMAGLKQPPLDEVIRRINDRLSESFDKTSLSSPMTLYRGLDINTSGTFTDKAFSFASPDRDIASDYGPVIQINAPKGARVIPTPDGRVFLIDRGSTFRFVGTKDGTRVFDLVKLSKASSEGPVDHASPQILRELVKESLAGLNGNMKDHIDEICNLLYEMDYAPDIPKGAGDWHQSLINMGDSLNQMVYGKSGTGGYDKANPYHDDRGRFTTGPGGGAGSKVKPKAPRGGKGGKNTKGGKKALAPVAEAVAGLADGIKPAEVAHKVKEATGGFKEWVARAWDSLEDDAKEEVLTLAVAVTVTAAVGLYLYFGALPSPLGAVRDMFGWLWRQLR